MVYMKKPPSTETFLTAHLQHSACENYTFQDAMCRHNFPANFCLVFVSFSLQQDVKRKGGKKTIAPSASERLIHTVKGCLFHLSLAQTLVFHYRDRKELKPHLTFVGNTAQVGNLTFFLTNSHYFESWKILSVWKTLHSDSV